MKIFSFITIICSIAIYLNDRDVNEEHFIHNAHHQSENIIPSRSVDLPIEGISDNSLKQEVVTATEQTKFNRLNFELTSQENDFESEVNIGPIISEDELENGYDGNTTNEEAMDTGEFIDPDAEILIDQAINQIEQDTGDYLPIPEITELELMSKPISIVNDNSAMSLYQSAPEHYAENIEELDDAHQVLLDTGPFIDPDDLLYSR